MLQQIRDFLRGKKTYITAVVGILTALLAWSGGELTDLQVIGAIWIALQVIFVRAGNKQDVANRVQTLNLDVVDEAREDGYQLGYRFGVEDAHEDTQIGEGKA